MATIYDKNLNVLMFGLHGSKTNPHTGLFCTHESATWAKQIAADSGNNVFLADDIGMFQVSPDGQFAQLDNSEPEIKIQPGNMVLTICFLNKSHDPPTPTIWVCTNQAAFDCGLTELKGMAHIQILQAGPSHVAKEA